MGLVFGSIVEVSALVGFESGKWWGHVVSKGKPVMHSKGVTWSD